MAKKKATKKSNLPALQEADLTSSALAAHANYDLDDFKGVDLGVVDNLSLFENDIIMPKIWLTQAMSEFRKAKKAEEGDYVDSQTGEVLAAEGTDLRLVVLKPFKKWQTFKLVNGKKEYLSTEVMVFGKNHALPYEETVDGEAIVRRQVISAYVLVERDAMQGLNKPYIIDFASSSKFGGRKMISDIKTLNDNGLPSFMGFFKLGSSEQKFDDGSAYVKDVKFGGYLPKKLIPFLKSCAKNLGEIENQIVMDDSDVLKPTNKTNKAAAKNKRGVARDAGI